MLSNKIKKLTKNIWWVFIILSKSKGEASRIEGLDANKLCSDLPRPYATHKFEEATVFIR